MIRVFGASNSPEHEAALQLQKLFLAEHPALRDSNEDHVAIIAGAKCHGQTVRDLDLVVLASFDPPLAYQPILSFANPFQPDQPETPASVNVQSICTIIELKEHPPDAVRFIGSIAEVKYGKQWHNVTEQSDKQIYSLRNFLSIKGLAIPYVTNLIWFRNLQNIDLPSRPHNMIAGHITWNMLFSVIAQVNPPRLIHQHWILTANAPNQDAVDQIRLALTEELTPTQLDRRRMEQINAQSAQIQKLQETAGRQLLILRGRGGAGKTIRLLQLAKTLYEEEGARVLILTYNRALVSDLRRTLTILGMVDEAAKRSIRVQTIHSFFYRMLYELGVTEIGQENFLEAYDDLKGEAVQLLENKLLLERDFTELKQNSSSDFLWDYIFIDEAQDWPDDERKILFQIYPPPVFTVADGVDQLIRSVQPADWSHSVVRTDRTVTPLRTCLRMKAGLTRFASALAGQLDLPPDEWLANEQVPGGRVIIIEGESIYRQSFFTDLLAYNATAGNEPIDMLFCVPPNLAHQTDMTTPLRCFTGWAFKVWDGTDPTIRGSYPTDNQQLRLVQYDSCRGLEGWVVVNFELDSFYDYKLTQLTQTAQSTTDSATIRLQAVRWLFIPLTRAMDTLVIHLTRRNSPLKKALQKAAAQHRDFVSWID
jgi:hypothetical protein